MSTPNVQLFDRDRSVTPEAGEPLDVDGKAVLVTRVGGVFHVYTLDAADPGIGSLSLTETVSRPVWEP